MSKFEQIGSIRQWESKTKEEAVKQLEISCNMCCNSPRANFCDCDHCYISIAHQYQVAALADAGRRAC